MSDSCNDRLTRKIKEAWPSLDIFGQVRKSTGCEYENLSFIKEKQFFSGMIFLLQGF